MNHVVFLCLFYNKNIQKEKKLCCCISGGHFGFYLKYNNYTAFKKKYVSFNSPITSIRDLIKMPTNIQRNFHFQISVFGSIIGNPYLVDILDAILNFCQGSMIS